jgi:hypothetical protein
MGFGAGLPVNSIGHAWKVMPSRKKRANFSNSSLRDTTPDRHRRKRSCLFGLRANEPDKFPRRPWNEGMGTTLSV